MKDNTNRTPSDRFIETARSLGCDEDEEAFRAKLREIVKQRPKNPAPTKPGDRT